MPTAMVLSAAVPAAPYHAAAQPRTPSAAAEAPQQPANSPPLPNPQLRIEPALNLVVLEFRDKVGEVALSIPSPKQIEAYRDKPRAEPSAGVDVSG